VTDDRSGRSQNPEEPQVKLTRYERRGLVGGWNLSDGHARHEFTPYPSVLQRMPELFVEGERGNLRVIDEEFESTFFRYAGQHSYSELRSPLYNYACSLSIEVVANYLRARRLSVSLIHPTFDNLADILRRNGVELRSLEQDWLTGGWSPEREIGTDALFLVCPNNPTGQNLTQAEFERVVEYCAARGKLLIIDFSFRFFSDFVEWDQYELLRRSGVDFIALEDTGKTWPTLDLKVGLTVASDGIYESLLRINEDLVLNVSPFTLKLLTAFIGIDANDGAEHARLAVAKTRRLLRELIEPTPLTLHSPDSVISVEWLRLPECWMASQLCEWLAAHDVHVLPGMPFYWARPHQGESYVRISLSRPQVAFIDSARRFASLVTDYATTAPSRATAV
jgi:aspartate/methionine/tyrosine aminotransferase